MKLTGPRLAVAMFSAVPVPRRWHRDAVTVGAAAATVAWLPLLGVLLGGLAGAPVAAVLAAPGGGPLLAAVVGVTALAVLTRGLHWDGLADTADGLGSRAAGEAALTIMRRSDIGPFGVLTLVLVLLADVAALADLDTPGGWRPVAVLAVAAGTGRVAVVHGCLRPIPPARSGGFGALVAGSTGPGTAAAVTGVALAAGGAVAWVVHANPLGWVLAQVAALTVAAGVRWHTTRRFGGITGDVFGALVEGATAVTLIGLAVAG